MLRRQPTVRFLPLGGTITLGVVRQPNAPVAQVDRATDS